MNKQQYLSPRLTVVAFKAERGYQATFEEQAIDITYSRAGMEREEESVGNGWSWLDM